MLIYVKDRAYRGELQRSAYQLGYGREAVDEFWGVGRNWVGRQVPFQ